MTEAQFRAARDNPELYVEALLKRRIRLPLTQRETGVLLGVSKESVRTIEGNAFAKIREAVAASRVCERRAV